MFAVTKRYTYTFYARSNIRDPRMGHIGGDKSWLKVSRRSYAVDAHVSSRCDVSVHRHQGHTLSSPSSGHLLTHVSIRSRSHFVPSERYERYDSRKIDGEKKKKMKMRKIHEQNLRDLESFLPKQLKIEWKEKENIKQISRLSREFFFKKPPLPPFISTRSQEFA